MKKTLFQDKEPNERLDALRANADKTEELTYTKSLTQIELDEFRENYSDKSIEFVTIEDEKKIVVEDYNKQLTPLNKQRETLLKIIKNKAIEIHGETFLFADFENGMMDYFDGNGELVYSRRLKPEEKQHTPIQSIRKIS
jgi:hypothetical protein